MVYILNHVVDVRVLLSEIIGVLLLRRLQPVLGLLPTATVQGNQHHDVSILRVRQVCLALTT